MDEHRGGLLSAGGILTIIVGAFEIIGGAMLVALASLGSQLGPWPRWVLPDVPGVWHEHVGNIIPVWPMVIGGILLVLGILAIIGGISAVRRQNFGLSLAGAICALIPVNLLGLLAVIFVSLGKREF
ncbi:MAG: hypothetical protein ACUVTR_05830 [Dehalococcoidia bacterium]